MEHIQLSTLNIHYLLIPSQTYAANRNKEIYMLGNRWHIYVVGFI
uniref:Uncharacterized protein n=1 Tax=Arundo donax TaxID=35708 RepID=A0A0A9CPE7_ARUDO